jgi:FtsP/CotA-like multicopper oxidase with cupredoxin domain
MNFGSNSSIRLVVVNNSPAVHPMHIHGHALSILAEGPTPPWDGTVTNQANPARRDTHLITPFGGFAVYQFNADNPGVWPFHCRMYNPNLCFLCPGTNIV